MLIPSSQELALMVIEQRKKLKLSQADVGKRVGLKQQTISAFENKPANTKLDTLFHILSAVHLDLLIVSKQNTLSQKKQWKEEW